jgi:hypothetical protein
MNPTPATTGNGGNFDPQQAAALLDETTQQARRRLEPTPPWLLTIRAFIALAVYGTIWLTVRDQHPYQHPTAAVIPVLIVLVVFNAVATITVARRATAGISGRSRLPQAQIAAVAVIWIAVFAVMGVLAGDGVSDRIAYGIYPATVPLMVGGLSWAAFMAARSNWRACGFGVAVLIVGVAGVFAGPAGAWAVAAVGLWVVLLGGAAAIAWRQRA